MFEKVQADNTKKLLSEIAKHLSGRDDCKQIEYVVSIKDNIHMFPLRSVFPSRHHRRASDKQSVIGHIFSEHLNVVDTNCLVRGVYMYELSADKKRRRWIKIED